MDDTGAKKGSSVFPALLVIGVIAAGGWYWVQNKPAKASERPAAAAIAVHTAPVTRADMPNYLEGLGAVTALNTVTITPRVDGELQSVAFTEGQNVKKGDLLAQIDPKPFQAALALAVAAKGKDEAQLQNAKRDLNRFLLLKPKNLVSKQALDTQQALVEQTEAQVKADQANIDNAKIQLDYATITSPIGGRTGIRLVDPGNNVHSTGTTGIVTITQMQPISVIFTLPEEALQHVNEAMSKGPVNVTAFSQDNKTVLDTGTLLLVDNQIDQTTGTLKLKATFPNANNTLWPGQFVNARLLLQVQEKALVMPSAATQHGPEGLFVYVVKPDSTIEVKPVKTGAEADGIVVVESGLEEGETVVTSNQYRLQPGIRIKSDAKEEDSPK